ncbi:MAG: histidine phosphatase family protein [Chloroflexi bacterium]|jgi:phosphohistidine phosphatase|nr:histidine phosphatase family protein [Chloroflexota bacterium]
MKKIFLMRHAKSSWKDSNIPDHDRPLKKKGEKDAKAMGKMLKSKKLSPDVILCSSAERAKQTAALFKDAISFDEKIELDDKLYMAEISDLITAIKKAPKKAKSVMVIGHNPGLEALLQTLTGKVETLPTSSIAYISVPIDEWSDLSVEVDGKLKKLWRPKDL